MRKMLVTALVILSVVSGTAMIAFGANDRMIVVVDENYPPYTFGTAKQANGLYTKLIEAIFARMGVKVEIQALHWEEALKAGQEGKAAVGGIYKNSARLKIYDYSEPLFEERLALYVKKGETFHFTRYLTCRERSLG